MASIELKYKKVYASGKRKAAIARAIITPGEGEVTFNKKELNTLHLFDKLKLQEPLKLVEAVRGKIEFNAAINVRGGGDKGQIDAGRLAMAKGIVEFFKDDEIKKMFLKYDRNLLVADVRRKETCKPGDSKARAKRQSSKR